jgi:hypothetical protein
MIDGVAGKLAGAIDAVRVNRCWQELRGQRTIWMKRRKLGADAIILAGNVFLTTSNSRIQMFPSAQRWVRWEVESFRLLNGDAFACGELDNRTVWFDHIPGKSLREILAETSAPAAVRAAAREFARGHGLQCPLRGVPWSHGDPHLGNVIYDDVADRARIIDFETTHDARLSAIDRQADDLLTFILELMAKSGAAAARTAADFLCEYGRQDVLRELRRRLVLPVEMELLLWRTRTDHAAPRVIAQWLRELRRLLD